MTSYSVATKNRSAHTLTKLKIQKSKSDGHWHSNHCVSRCAYHVVFCTKYRRKVLTPPAQKAVRAILKELQDSVGYQLIELGIEEDHIHLVIQCDPTIGVNTVVTRIKGILSRELRKKFPHCRTRLPTLWSRSRYIASVGDVKMSAIGAYIEDQKNV